VRARVRILSPRVQDKGAHRLHIDFGKDRVANHEPCGLEAVHICSFKILCRILPAQSCTTHSTHRGPKVRNLQLNPSGRHHFLLWSLDLHLPPFYWPRKIPRVNLQCSIPALSTFFTCVRTVILAKQLPLPTVWDESVGSGPTRTEMNLVSIEPSLHSSAMASPR
jgi:hypothetical protein